MKKTLNHEQVYNLIKTVGHKRTVIVSGEFGCGKTALVDEFRNDPFFSNHSVLQPVECTQLSDGDLSMPSIDEELGVSRLLPNERFGVHANNQKGVNGSKPIVLCFDEVGKIPQRIINMIAAPLYERRFGIYTMPERSIVFGLTNLTDEGLGDNLPAHILNRVVHVHLRKPTQPEWERNFAIPRKLDPVLIAATDKFPQIFDSYLDYQPGGKHAGRNIRKDNPWISNPHDAEQEQVVTPRSLHAASDILIASRTNGLDDHTLEASLEGTLGASFTSELMSYIRFGRDIPSFARVVADPAKCPLVENPVAQMVQVFQFCTQTTMREEAAAVVEYVQRMRAEMRSLFITRVANTPTVLSMYITNADFGVMLASNRQFMTM